MPFVNIPRSKLLGSMGRIVGKLLGKLSAQGVTMLSEVQSEFRREGCPAPDKLGRTSNKASKLKSQLGSIDSRISKIAALPPKLKAPQKGLKAAIKIILSLPIPQSVPPGFGIPVNITTKFADILHLLKEFVIQLGEDIEGIEAILELPADYLSSLKSISGRVDSAIKACEIENNLKSQLAEGKVDKKDLQDIGILDDDEVFIFSKLGPIFIGNLEIDDNGKIVTKETGQSRNNKSTDTSDQDSNISTGSDLAASLNLNSTPEEANEVLLETLRRIQDSNLDIEIKNELRLVIESFIIKDESTIPQGEFFHTGPNGITYKLEIITDPNSPQVAPKRFAVAIEPRDNIVVLKGQPSFSSSTKILLEEIKFRIDNQLP